MGKTQSGKLREIVEEIQDQEEQSPKHTQLLIENILLYLKQPKQEGGFE